MIIIDTSGKTNLYKIMYVLKKIMLRRKVPGRGCSQSSAQAEARGSLAPEEIWGVFQEGHLGPHSEQCGMTTPPTCSSAQLVPEGFVVSLRGLAD